MLGVIVTPSVPTPKPIFGIGNTIIGIAATLTHSGRPNTTVEATARISRLAGRYARTAPVTAIIKHISAVASTEV